MAVRIIKESMYDNWVSDTITYNGKDYRYEAKVFDECSDYGINKGRISKLHVTRDGEDVINYDRGWDIKPQDKDTIKVFKMILDKYPEDHSIEEDTVKLPSGKWVNKGDTGKTHGEFKTKKAADAQRKAMYAQGFEGESKQVKEYTIKKQPGYQDMLIFDKGEIYKTDSGEFEVLDQLGDYVLLKNTNEKSFTPYIVADFPMKRSWAQGHYFRTYEDALDDFNERTSRFEESKKLKEDTGVSATSYGEEDEEDYFSDYDSAIQLFLTSLSEEIDSLDYRITAYVDESNNTIKVIFDGGMSFILWYVFYPRYNEIYFVAKDFQFKGNTISMSDLKEFGEALDIVGKFLSDKNGLILQY